MARQRIKTVVNDVISERGAGTHGTSDIKGQFPGTPELNGYDAAAAMAIYQSCLDGVQTENVDFETGVNMDYGDAPSISTDITFTGDVLSPYMPNVVVPPNMNPASFNKWPCR